MAEIILAFILGALLGWFCGYLRYIKFVREHLQTLNELKLRHARLAAAYDVLAELYGVDDEENETEDSKWPKQNVNRFNKPSFLDDNHNSSGLLDED